MSAGKTKAPGETGRLRIAPDLALEVFGEEAIVFLAEHDRWITVNKAAAALLRLMRRTFGRRGFTPQQLADALRRHYHLNKVRAREEAASLCREWRRLQILRPRGKT